MHENSSTGSRLKCRLLQVDLPLSFTLTVSNQSIADAFHGSPADPPFPSPRDPSTPASRADAVALALTSLIQTDGLYFTMPDLGDLLTRSSFSYPLVTNAQASLAFANSTGEFYSAVSPVFNSSEGSLQAFMEASVYEMDEAIRNLPAISPLAQVSV
jgi:hypothetical protein